MKKRNIQIKNKIINHCMINGKKKTSEKIFLKSYKELQKNSKKRSLELLKLSLISVVPVFKFNIMEIKKRKKKIIKEIPVFIPDKNYRISLAIKFILSTIKKNSMKFYKNLNKEILLNSQLKGSANNIKNELQKQILTKKHYFFNYRWK